MGGSSRTGSRVVGGIAFLTAASLLAGVILKNDILVVTGIVLLCVTIVGGLILTVSGQPTA
jgi:hypothetical protein